MHIIQNYNLKQTYYSNYSMMQIMIKCPTIRDLVGPTAAIPANGRALCRLCCSTPTFKAVWFDGQQASWQTLDYWKEIIGTINQTAGIPSQWMVTISTLWQCPFIRGKNIDALPHALVPLLLFCLTSVVCPIVHGHPFPLNIWLHMQSHGSKRLDRHQRISVRLYRQAVL